MVRAFGDDPRHVNTWVLFFPYVWLPAVLVTIALAGHIVLTRALLLELRHLREGASRRSCGCSTSGAPRSACSPGRCSWCSPCWGIGDHDAADVHDLHGADHGGGFGLLSVRALAAFLAFFGLVGWWLTDSGMGPVPSAALSLVAGGAAMAAVGWLLSQQRRLDVEGNLDPANAVGATATVYLRVPAQGQGAGKIHVKVQGRTAEVAAVSDGPAIATGAMVSVRRLVSPDTVAVSPLEAPAGDR